MGFVLAVACVAMLVIGSKPKAISLSPADAVAAATAARQEVIDPFKKHHDPLVALSSWCRGAL